MSGLPDAPAPRILRSETVQPWIDGYAFLQAAQEEARTIQAATRTIEEEARAAGFARGREEGLEDAARLLATTADEVERYLAGLECGLADLALAVVREVLGDVDVAERIALSAKRALSAFREQQGLVLYVAPDQVDATHGRLGSVLADRVTVVADDSLAPEQARLSSAASSIELTLETQLQALRETLLPRSAEPAP